MLILLKLINYKFYEKFVCFYGMLNSYVTTTRGHQRQSGMLRDFTYIMIEMFSMYAFAQKIPSMKKGYCTVLDSNTFSQNISLRFA